MSQPSIQLVQSDPVADAIDRELESLRARRDELLAMMSPVELRIAQLVGAKESLAGVGGADNTTKKRRITGMREGTKAYLVRSILTERACPMRVREVCDAGLTRGLIVKYPSEVATILVQLAASNSIRRVSKGVYEALRSE